MRCRAAVEATDGWDGVRHSRGAALRPSRGVQTRAHKAQARLPRNTRTSPVFKSLFTRGPGPRPSGACAPFLGGLSGDKRTGQGGGGGSQTCSRLSLVLTSLADADLIAMVLTSWAFSPCSHCAKFRRSPGKPAGPPSASCGGSACGCGGCPKRQRENSLGVLGIPSEAGAGVSEAWGARNVSSMWPQYPGLGTLLMVTSLASRGSPFLPDQDGCDRGHPPATLSPGSSV